MATASKMSPTVRVIEDDIKRDRERRFELAHLHGIKNHPIWQAPDRYMAYIYFLLPQPPPEFVMVENNLNVKEFAVFWSKLDDNHKERRLLASFMTATIGDGIKPADPNSIRDWMLEIALNCTIPTVSTAVLVYFRRIFIKQQPPDRFDLGAMAKNFFMAFHGNENPRFPTIFQAELFSKIVFFVHDACMELAGPALAKMAMQKAPAMIEKEAKFVAQETLYSFITMYSVWKCLDERGKLRFLGKLPHCLWKIASVPHWPKFERSHFLEAIKTNGNSCDGPYSYVRNLIIEIEKKRFQELFFGKEKFCAHCHRSSYTGEERLWCCRRCVEEDIRPKARYCNEECQKTHWKQHLYEAHGGKKPAERTALASPLASVSGSASTSASASASASSSASASALTKQTAVKPKQKPAKKKRGKKSANWW